MDLKEYFDKIDLQEIDRFIEEAQEENVFLEFKTANNNKEGKEFDKKNISKCVSGFANSNGGIIIWGVKASKTEEGHDVAHSKKPINQLKKFLNTLNTLEGQAVTPAVEAIIHIPLEFEKNEGFIKTFVPASSSAPHMANFADKHYFKRSGDSFYPCEHYDIMDIISRQKNANLEVQLEFDSEQLIHQVRKRYFVKISIFNSGNATAKYPYLAFNLNMGYNVVPLGLGSKLKETGLKRVNNNFEYQHNYSGGSDQVIYPKTKLDVDLITIEIPREQNPAELHVNFMVMADNAAKTEGTLVFESEKFKK